MNNTRHYRIERPPKALRKAKLDNIALVPASLLYRRLLPAARPLCEDTPLLASGVGVGKPATALSINAGFSNFSDSLRGRQSVRY